MKQKVRDMTKGKPVSLVFSIAFPMVLGFLLQQLYTIADTLIAGKMLGADALAATGIAGNVIFFMLSVTIGLNNTYSILISQFFGAKDTDGIRKTVINAVFVSMIYAVILSVLTFSGVETLLRWIGTPQEILVLCADYLKIYIGIGIFPSLLYSIGSALLNAVGNTRTPVIISTTASLINIVLDILFISWFDMGIKGLALASITGQFFTLFACLFVILRYYKEYLEKSRENWRFDPLILREIMRIGVPYAIQMLMVSFGDLFVNGVVNQFGTNVITAFVTCLKVQNVATGFYNSIAMAFAIYAGQNYGALLMERIKNGFIKVAGIVAVLSLISTVVIYRFNTVFIGAFLARSEPGYNEIIAVSDLNLKISAVFFPFLALIWLYNEALRGMGEVRIPFISSMIEVVVKIGLSVLMARWFGYVGVWFVCPIGWVLGIIPAAWRFHGGKWMVRRENVVHQM